MKEKVPLSEILNNWAKFAVVVGTLPWSYYYMTSLAPVINHALGVDQMKFVQVGVYIIPIVFPPLLLYSYLSRNDDHGEG